MGNTTMASIMRSAVRPATESAAHASNPESTATLHLEVAPPLIGIARRGSLAKAERRHKPRQIDAVVEATALGGTAKADVEAAKATAGQQTRTSTMALTPITVCLARHRHHLVITAEAAEEGDHVLADRVAMPDPHRPLTNAAIPRRGRSSTMLGTA